MSYSLWGVLTASNDGEGAFWMQMLMLLMLAGGCGVYSLVKSSRRGGKQRRYIAVKGHIDTMNWRDKSIERLKEIKRRTANTGRRVLHTKAAIKAIGKIIEAGRSATDTTPQDALLHRTPSGGRAGTLQKATRNTFGGMELLGLDFLLEVVERMEENSEYDLTMQKLVFGELVRRGQLGKADSRALVAYATDEKGVYGKKIQRAAMEELAGRTQVSSAAV
jgi:hypothetical protein